jgi:hypothetical protein
VYEDSPKAPDFRRSVNGHGPKLTGGERLVQRTGRGYFVNSFTSFSRP